MAAKPIPERPPADPRQVALIAAAISFLFPGIGPFLVHAWARGAIWALGWVVVGLAGGGVALLALMAISAVDAYAFARQLPPPSTAKPS